MVLNRLPVIDHCCFCIKPQLAVFLITVISLLAVSALWSHSDFFHLPDTYKSSMQDWFLGTLMLWIAATFILISASSGLVTKAELRDILLQVYIWLMVAMIVLHFIFCILYIVLSWNINVVPAIIHLSVFLTTIAAVIYLLLVVNTFRMRL